MKVKKLVEIIHPAASVYIEDPSDRFPRNSPPLVSIMYILECYGNRIVKEVTTEHDWDSSFLYIILEEEE